MTVVVMCQYWRTWQFGKYVCVNLCASLYAVISFYIGVDKGIPGFVIKFRRVAVVDMSWRPGLNKIETEQTKPILELSAIVYTS